MKNVNLRAGDIIFFKSNGKNKKWYLKILAFFIKHLEDEIEHVALYYGKDELGNDEIIEAYEGENIRKRKIYLGSNNIQIMGVKDTELIPEEEIISKLILFFNKTKSMEYSEKDWINVAWARITKELVGKRYYLFHNDKKGFICSEYARDFWYQSFIINLRENLKTPSPLETLRSDKLFIKKPFKK